MKLLILLILLAVPLGLVAVDKASPSTDWAEVSQHPDFLQSQHEALAQKYSGCSCPLCC